MPVNPKLAAIDVGKLVGTLNGIQNITTIDQLNTQKTALAQALTDLKTHLTDQDNQVNDLQQQVNTHQATILDLQKQNADLTGQAAAHLVTINDLTGRLAAVTSAPPPANPIALADSFRQVIDQVQSQARMRSATGPATSIKSMDIEVKGLVNVQQDGTTVMVLPTLATPIDPNQLSTLRVSYAAVPGTGTAPPPVVSSVTPTRGPAAGGTSIVIAGSGFTGAGAVQFGGSPAASFTLVNDTQITAVSPGGAGTVDVTVVTAAGGASSAAATDQFTFVPTPTVVTVNPAGGPAAGKTEVSVTGTGFTGATAVTFGPNAAPSIKVASDTQLVAISPTGSPGVVDIVVTAPGGASAANPADRFTYSAPPPAVTAITPNAGLIAGGAQVTITGTNFIGVTAVTFGSTGASSVTVNSDTQLVAVSPQGAVGTVDIIVTTPSGNSPATQADQFTYRALVLAGPHELEAKPKPPKKPRKR